VDSLKYFVTCAWSFCSYEYDSIKRKDHDLFIEPVNFKLQGLPRSIEKFPVSYFSECCLSCSQKKSSLSVLIHLNPVLIFTLYLSKFRFDTAFYAKVPLVSSSEFSRVLPFYFIILFNDSQRRNCVASMVGLINACGAVGGVRIFREVWKSVSVPFVFHMTWPGIDAGPPQKEIDD
jgi:hypothetical protein